MQIDQQHQQEDAHKIQMTAVLLLGCKPQRKSDTSERVHTSPDSRLLVILLMFCTDPTKPFLIHNELFIPTRWITLRIDEGFEILGGFHRSDDERVKEVRSVVSSEEEYLLGKRVFVIFI